MFTGLVESLGTVVRRHPDGAGGAHLTITCPFAPELTLGESVAVNGACLTVVENAPADFHVQLGPETLQRTCLGLLEPGHRVNLERSLRVGDRLGGHFVQGHVDAVGTVVDVRPDGDFTWVRIRFPREIAPQLVLKGAIAVDGISLTVAALGEDSFDVQIIPHTWTHTNLRGAHAGMRVNLECDIIGK